MIFSMLLCFLACERKTKVISKVPVRETPLSASAGYSLSDLAGASQLLIDTFENKSNFCKLNSSEKALLPQKMRAVLDERFRLEREQYLKLSAAQKQTYFPMDCASECSCKIYDDFLEFLQKKGVQLSVTESTLKTRFHEAAGKKANPAVKCAEVASRWFCSSPLLTSFR